MFDAPIYKQGCKVVMVCQHRTGLTLVAGTVQALAVPQAAIARQDLESKVAKLITERRRRHAYFAAGLFSDPAWDILLALALSESRHHRLTTTKLCKRLDVPMTTALRWISALTCEGLLVRRDDPNDKRRKFIELSSDAHAAMVAYCSTVETARSRAA